MEAFVLASGPSLTPEDVETVRLWRSESYSRLVIVTNTTWELAPWADYLYAWDGRWLRVHGQAVKDGFKGRVWSWSMLSHRYGVTFARTSGLKQFGNSGTCAISLAILQRATRVYLLGMDCQRTGGKTHWHADHEKPLTNAATLENWPADFERCAQYAKQQGVEVINCSRHTALKVFPRLPLEDVTSGQGSRRRDVPASRREASGSKWDEARGEVGLDGSVQPAPRNGTSVFEAGGH